MTSNDAKKAAFKRLPDEVIPVHYDVFLRPDLAAFSFTGRIKVELDVKKATSKLVCNAAELQVSSVKVNEREVESSVVSEKEETLTLTLANPLSEGSKATLTCDFVGSLNDKMKGFYRSKYTQDGQERYAAVTQFEATDARRAFPCWDEPALKATFSISLSAPKDRVVLSNMPVVSESADPDDPERYRVCCFDKSPRMSTYLVAFVVGEFDYVESRSREGTVVRVYTPVGKSEQGRYALEASVKAISYYKDFFGVGYPLPKYDCIALADFQCGAMENWGLVTFRETALLVDEANTSANSKQWIAIVVTHEMAHQWFGNLVTMEWWTHLWLNEGFASFMENMCTNDLFPEYDIWTQFVNGTLIHALKLDALDNSHAIEVEVGHPSEVDEIFDDISYNKGASIIRMLYDYMGRDVFGQGMKHYLVKHMYKNTQTEDLWASLETVTHKPIGKIMSTWTGQMGFPVILVSSRVEGRDKVVTLRQEKFSARAKPGPAEGSLWAVPIRISTASGQAQQVLLEASETTVTLTDPGAWFKLNPGFSGYYRVAYETKQDLANLRSAIEGGSLDEIDRLSLVDDIFALVRSGRVGSVEALELLKAFKAAESSYVVWSTVLTNLSKVRVLLAHDEKLDEKFKAFTVDLLSCVAQKVGWVPSKDEPHVQGLLRSQVLSRMGAYGHKETVGEARKRFSDHVSDKEAIPADLRNAVYRTVAANGTMETHEQLLKLYRQSDLHEEKERLGMAMGCSSDPATLRTVLGFAMSGEVRLQDRPFVVGSVAANMRGRSLALAFLKDNFAALKADYQSGALMNRLCKVTTENFATAERANEIAAFFADKADTAERTVRQSVENVEINSEWFSRDEAALRAFFA